MNWSLKPYFKQITTAGALGGVIFLGGCATVVNPPPESCMGGGGVSVLGVGVRNVGFDEKCAAYQKERQTREADISRAQTLLQKPNDPVANALGMLLSLELSPDARKQLVKRMDGQEISVKPETLIGLLTAPTINSQYVGYQLYAASSDEIKAQVDQQLKEKNIDITKLSLTTGQRSETVTTTKCQRERVGNEIILHCPAAPANKP